MLSSWEIYLPARYGKGFQFNVEVVVNKKPRKINQVFKVLLAGKIMSEEKGELL